MTRSSGRKNSTSASDTLAVTSMSDDLKMPLIRNVALNKDVEGVVTRVFRRKGFYVETNDPIAEVRVGHNTLTIGSSDDGLLVEVYAYPGNRVTADATLAVVSLTGTYDGIFNRGPFANAIFLAYRRSDSSGYTGRIYDRLVHDFGRWHVFRDIGSIKPGKDFREQVRQALVHARIMLVVIGPGWLDAKDESGKRRIDNPDDLHRVEIRFVLERGLPIIPLLVGQTSMPKPEELPDDIRNLSYRAAIPLSDNSWEHDAELLHNALADLLEQSRTSFIPALVKGDSVSHPKFGMGEVMIMGFDSSGKETVEVQFSREHGGRVRLSGAEAVGLRRTVQQ